MTGRQSSAGPVSEELRNWFGGIDVYLFDQLLKGRFDTCRRVLDVGCGGGRNLVYLLGRGFEVYAVDREADAIEAVRRLSSNLAPQLSTENFRVSEADKLPFEAASMDVVLSSAVLHFAADELHFTRMIDEMWRVLAPGGLLFARLASTIGIEQRVQLVSGRRYRLPDRTERFLVDENLLRDLTTRLGGEWIEPIKTTNVENLRAMTTWCVAKPSWPASRG